MRVKTKKARLLLVLLNTTGKTPLMNGKRLVGLRTSKAHEGSKVAFARNAQKVRGS